MTGQLVQQGDRYSDPGRNIHPTPGVFATPRGRTLLPSPRNHRLSALKSGFPEPCVGMRTDPGSP